jgi:methionyl-tRNA synthetase
VCARPGSLDAGDRGIETRFQSAKIDYNDSGPALLEEVFDRYEALDYAGALAVLWGWVGELNQRIVAEAPWEMAKDPERRGELHAFLYRLLEAIRLLGVMVWPVMPRASRRIFVMLGLPDQDPAPDALVWGVLRPGQKLGQIQPLFPRIDVEGARKPRPAFSAAEASLPAEPRFTRGEALDEASAGARTPIKEKTVPETPKETSAAPPAETTQAASPSASTVDIAEFAKIELRAAQVTAAEKIAGSRKLLRLEVDLGGEKRQIVSGIADAYAPESLVGRKIVLVANLKPAKVMGVESNGMLLAASVDGRAVICTFDTDVPLGAKVK